ncbi:hypothetical protein Pyn_27461 [Prunus yedoensis var. nudiflora]|uniref:Uncharacterized protein n=1 Tax=Prunus yedoensis var. nudiflora TaxID=2094558 RepID=A0A314XXJ3_PRUYE|nr:hypothetical protein Pyn_27461 [Prunus yedoensis var. nudiflora]
MNVAIVTATAAARAAALAQGQATAAAAPPERSFFTVTENRCMKIVTGQLHGPHHSAILMELRETMQSDAAKDHIMPHRERLRRLHRGRFPQT